MNELIELAKEKGFKKSLKTAPDGFVNSLDKYIWLCLLQKWIREEHDVWITVETWKFVLRNKDHTIQYRILCDDDLIPRTKFGKEMLDGFGDTYEQALEEGCKKALELV